MRKGEFAFQLGDVVRHRCANPKFLFPRSEVGGERPNPYIVLGRAILECAGGFDHIYSVSGSSGRMFLVEQELENA